MYWRWHCERVSGTPAFAKSHVQAVRSKPLSKTVCCIDVDLTRAVRLSINVLAQRTKLTRLIIKTHRCGARLACRHQYEPRLVGHASAKLTGGTRSARLQSAVVKEITDVAAAKLV